MVVLLNDKAMYGVTVRYAYCDNAWENEAFEWLCKQEGMGVKLEYTMSGTLQQNGRVERKFTTLCNQVHAMMNSVKFYPSLKNCL